MKSATRTLVKSPPELWEMLDQPERMQGLMSALVGHATEIDVAEREPETRLAWEARSHLEPARIEIEIAEKGWGTSVSISAENGSGPTQLEGWLNAVIDELATPTKRPFAGVTESTEHEVIQPAAAEPEVAEPEDAEPEVAAPHVATAEETPAEPMPEEPAPARKRRRFFRF